MKGEINIKLTDVDGEALGLAINLNVQEADAFGCILMLNSLANALELTKMDRMVLCAMLSGIGGVPTDTMMVVGKDSMPEGMKLTDVNMEELFKQMKEGK